MALVRVLAGEYVVAHGTQTTEWSLRSGSRWVSLGSVEGVVTERVSLGPGTIWQTLFELDVPEGTFLLRTDTAPLPRRHADPMEYLRREVRGARRRVSRRHYRVNARGELILCSASDVPR
jgi:hypothetical protein